MNKLFISSLTYYISKQAKLELGFAIDKLEHLLIKTHIEINKYYMLSNI